MSEYAVNKQTGEVLKRDQSGSWQKVKSAKNASGEILINEGGGWGAVPSAQSAQPASPFLQKGMGMLPEGTQPVFPAGAMESPAARPVSRLEAASLGAERGGSFALADEAAGVRNALNIIPSAPGPIGALTTFGTGLAGMAMEALPGEPSQAYVQGRDARRTAEDQARTQHPVTFTGAEIGGSVVVPVGGTARAATKTGQIAKGITAGAASGGVYGFAAEDGTLEERAKAGATGAAVGGAFGGILSTVIPRDIPLGDVLNAELFGAKVSRPVLKTIERMLVDAGVPANRVEAGVVNIRQRLQSGDVGTGLPTRFKDELVKEFGESARGVSKAIETQIRGGAARSGSASDTAVARVVDEDNAAARELFERSVDQLAGSTNRPELRGQALDQLQEIVETQYKPILSAGIADPAKQQALVGVLAQPRMQSLASELAEDAEREGIDLAALIARNPAEAAHWMQSKARQLADDKGKVTITGRVVPDRTMSNRRKDILDALEDAVPGYRETRMEYGDKFGVMQAVNFAKGFMTRAKDDVSVADMAEEFADMSAAQKQMALASVRSVLQGSAGNVRYVDPELGTGALRTAEIGKEPVLKALSEVFGDQGTKVADDIKAIVTRTDANRRINPQATGSDTTPKAEAIKFAMRNTRGPIQRVLGNMLGGAPMDMLGSAVAGGPTPIAAARAGIEGAGRMADSRAMSTVDQVTELLLSRPQNALARAAPGPQAAPPTGAGPSSGGGQIIDQLQPNALSGATMSGQRGGKPPPAPRGQDTIASEIADIERTLKRKGYTLNEAETLAEDGRLPEELRGLMIVHADLVRESGRMQGAGARAKGGAGNDPEYLRAESDMNKASDDVANAEAEIARDLREQGLNWEGETGDFMGVIDTLQREGRLSNYLTSRVADLRAASTRMLDAEAKMKARVQSLSGQPSPIRAGGFAGAPSSQPNAQWARESDGTMRAAFPDNPDVNLIVNPEGEVLFSVGGKIKGRKEGGTAQDFVNAVNAVIPALRQHASGPDALPFYSFSGASESQANIYRRLLGRGISDDMAAYETLPGEFVISRLSPEDLQRALPETPLRRITEQDASPLTLSKKDRVNPLPRNGLTIGPNAQNALAGAGLGGIAPADSAEERARNMAIGAGLGGVAGRLPVRSMADDVARTAGAPKTAAQAAKFETPGSPEWEAAKAKGLDMSTAARKQRALAAGYNTDQVWYHGTRKDFDAFDTSKSTDGLGIHVGTVDQAEGFAKSTKSLSMQNQAEFKSNRQILPLYVRANNSIRLPDMQDWEPNRVVRALRRKGIDVEGSGYQGAVMPKDIVSALKREGYDSIVYKNMFEADASGKDSLIIFDPSNIRSVNAAFDPDKAASPILTAGAGGGRKPPNPDSPEAIKAALKDMTAKPKAEPTRLARMVEEGRNADVPPIRGLPDQDVALTEQAMRMEERGLSPIEIYDQTGVAMVPYNGAQVPIISPKMGPEELTRQFYTALAEPASKRPDWVKEILARAPRKKGLMLRDKAPAPTQPNALAEPPLPSPGTPYGAIGIGAGIGAATGIPAGAVIGTMMAREQDRKRNALAQ